MTRRVRSGNSQKHKKMPGDATKWGEFDNQRVKEIPFKKNKIIESQTDLKQKLNFSPFNSTLGKTPMSLNQDLLNENKYCLTENSNKMSELLNDSIDEAHNIIASNAKNEDANANFSNRYICGSKIGKNMKKQKNFNIKYSPLSNETDEVCSIEVSNRDKKIKLENDCSVVTQDGGMPKHVDNHDDFAEKSARAEGSFSQLYVDKKSKKKMKQNDNSNDETPLSNYTSFDNSNTFSSMEQDGESIDFSVKTNEFDKSFQDKSSKNQRMNKHGKIISDSNQSSMNNEYNKIPSPKMFINKKEKYFKKFQKQREKLGLLVLPHNVECKLRNIRKKLAEKGFPPEKQKEIMRQARRKEELKFRKVINPSKLCFGCRAADHILANCPQKSGSLKQETGICFKCGSIEHTSFRCSEKVQGFPYAKCFICNEQGHISRDCSKNKHGIYPKGGRCKLCGNVNHLKKDCPTLKRKEHEEENITLHTIGEDVSIDAEIVKKEEIRNKSKKKANIVKF